jgi:SAM-dependent methyltransferase
MAPPDHPIHDFLASVVGPAAGTSPTLLDLGCGSGGTLAALGRIAPGATLVGLDSSEPALGQARALLAAQGPEVRLEQADLERPLPMADASIDAIVCHNVLECLADPAALLREGARVLRRGGMAVWSHVDFEAIVIAGAEVALDRRVLASYADSALTWAAHSDARMGRKLAGLVRSSPLGLERVETHVVTCTELGGAAAARVEEIAQAARREAASGKGRVTLQEVDRWSAELLEAAARGRFFFAETSFVAVSRRPQAG